MDGMAEQMSPAAASVSVWRICNGLTYAAQQLFLSALSDWALNFAELLPDLGTVTGKSSADSANWRDHAIRVFNIRVLRFIIWQISLGL